MCHFKSLFFQHHIWNFRRKAINFLQQIQMCRCTWWHSDNHTIYSIKVMVFRPCIIAPHAFNILVKEKCPATSMSLCCILMALHSHIETQFLSLNSYHLSFPLLALSLWLSLLIIEPCTMEFLCTCILYVFSYCALCDSVQQSGYMGCDDAGAICLLPFWYFSLKSQSSSFIVLVATSCLVFRNLGFYPLVQVLYE